MTDTRNRKLRLLVTTLCHNSCPKCCNKQYDMSQVPVLDRFDYDEVCITGGEPMLNPPRVRRLATMFKMAADAMGKDVKVYLYTARIDPATLYNMVVMERILDGVVVTPHSADDIKEFKYLNWRLREMDLMEVPDLCSLRLNLFSDVKEKLRGEDLSYWKVKDMEWLDDCPVPEGEDFRKIAGV